MQRQTDIAHVHDTMATEVTPTTIHTQVMVLVSQKPLVGRSHERMKQQKRWVTPSFDDVEQIDEVTIFG